MGRREVLQNRTLVVVTAELLLLFPFPPSSLLSLLAAVSEGIVRRCVVVSNTELWLDLGEVEGIHVLLSIFLLLARGGLLGGIVADAIAVAAAPREPLVLALAGALLLQRQGRVGRGTKGDDLAAPNGAGETSRVEDSSVHIAQRA